VIAMSKAEEDRVVTAWREMSLRCGMPTVRMVTTERRSKLHKRLCDIGIEGMLEAIAAVERSPFCRGENDRGWRADFDFILQPRSLAKLLEHGYQQCAAPYRNSALQMYREAVTEAGVPALGPVQPDLLG
jgi:hypothetical protein